MSSSTNKFIVFILNSWRVALPLPKVERVMRIVEIAYLPNAPEIVTGIINIHGRIIPMVDVRKRFRLPQRAAKLTDHIIIANTSKRTVGLVVDEVDNVGEYQPEELVTTEQILPGIEHIEGIAKTRDGLIVIYDIDRFLSLEEEKKLNEAINEMT